MVLERIDPNENLRKSYPKLNAAIDAAEKADGNASVAKTNAEQAIVTANNVQEQFNQVIIEGDSSVEAAQARVKADGTSFTTLKERLDDTDSQLEEISVLSTNFIHSGDVDDTASINRALSHVNSFGGGKVRIPFKSTPYILSAPLIIYSNTHLEVDTHATIKLANEANCRMIENANKTTQASLSRIDKNIKITGGIWDGNGTNQSKKWDGTQNTTSLMSGFLFSGIDHFVFKPTKIINTRVYGVLIANVNDLLIENVEVNVGIAGQPDNRDGIHILGPAENIHIRNCKLHSEDNIIAINADDVGHGPFGTFGDIVGVRINNVIFDNSDGGQGMLLLSADHALKDVIIDGVTGSAAYLLNLSTFDFGEGNYDDITIKNCDITRINPQIWHQAVMIRGKYETINLENIVFRGNETTISATRAISAFVTEGTPVTAIDTLNIKNVTMNNAGVNGGGYFNVVSLYASATVKNLTINGITSKNNKFRCIPVELQSSSAADYVYISNLDIDNAPSCFMSRDSNIKKLVIENVFMDENSVRLVDYNSALALPNLNELILNNTGITKITSTANIDKVIIDGQIKINTAPADAGYYQKGQVIYSNDPLTLGYMGWVCTRAGSPFNTLWQSNTAYNVGDHVRNGSWVFKCIVAGISGSTAPATTGDIIDGTVTWRYMYEGLALFELFGPKKIQEAWQVPTLTNSWVNLGSPYSTAGFYKDRFNVVHLKGLIQGGAAGSVAFTLPDGYGPQEAMYFPGTCASNFVGSIIVDSARTVRINTFNSWISLDGVSFRVGDNV